MKVCRWLLLILCLAMPLPAVGQSEGPQNVADLLNRLDAIERERRQVEPPGRPPAPPDEFAESTPLAAGSGLLVWGLVVAALIAAAAVVVRRVRPPVDLTDGSLEVVESVWVGRGQRVMLLRVRDQEVLVGAAGSQLSSLAVFAAPTKARVKERSAAPSGLASREEAQDFVALVEGELNEAARGGKLRNRQNILRRLNDI